jgi:hypothetical protein
MKSVRFMKFVRFLRLLDACGGDLTVWPQPEQAAARRLLARDPRAREALVQTLKLDELIREGLGQKPGEERAAENAAEPLFARPLPSQRRRLFGPEWLSALVDWTMLDGALRPSWPRVAALACAGALGISLGLLTPELWTAREPERFTVSGDSDPGGLILDGESDSGIIL